MGGHFGPEFSFLKMRKSGDPMACLRQRQGQRQARQLWGAPAEVLGWAKDSCRWDRVGGSPQRGAVIGSFLFMSHTITTMAFLFKYIISTKFSFSSSHALIPRKNK